MGTEPKPRRRNRLPLLLGLVAVLCLCIVVFAIASPGTKDTSQPNPPTGASSTPQPASAQAQHTNPPPTAIPPTAPPTSTPVPELGTTDNPIPYGASVEVSLGLLGLGPSAEITVLEVIRGQEAWDKIYIANIYNSRAPEGFEWMLVKVRIVSKSSTDQTANVGPSLFAVRSGGRLTEYFDVAMDVCCLEDVKLQPLEDAQLYGGAEIEGWIAYPVGIDDPTPLLKVGDVYLSVTPPT